MRGMAPAILAVLLLVGCGGGSESSSGSQGSLPSEDSSADSSAAYEGVQPVSGTPSENQFGTSVEFTNGAVVTVETPSAFEPSAQSAGHKEGNRAVTMNVTAENRVQDGEYKPEWVQLSARAGSRECTRVFDAGDLLAYPQTPLRPGDEVTWLVGWSCPDSSAAELVVTATASNMDPQGSALWVGPLDGASARSDAGPGVSSSAASTAEQAASLLADAGLCYPTSESIAKNMGDVEVCMKSPDDSYVGVLISPQAWGPEVARENSGCSANSDLDNYGVVTGESWYLQATMRQPRAVMEKYAQITGGELITWKVACG